MVLKEKEAKECVAYYRRDLTSITFCLVSLDRKRAVCTRHQGILMTCHNNPTIERNFAINNPSFSSALRRSNYRLRIRLSLVVIISGIEKSLSTEAGRNWKRQERNGVSRGSSYSRGTRCAAMFLSYASSYLVDPLPQPRTRSIGELGKGSRVVQFLHPNHSLVRFPIPCFFKIKHANILFHPLL